MGLEVPLGPDSWPRSVSPEVPSGSDSGQCGA